MKITDTIDAKIITILDDYFEHDADRMADAMLELKALFTSEIKKARNEGRQDFIDQVNLDDYKDCDCECHNFKKGKE
jgi:hypothetical protein